MPCTEHLKRWLVSPPFAGWLGLVAILVAVALPTLLRASVDGIVTGVGFTPYTPFVMLTALAVGWRQAIVVALAGAVIGDLLFVGSPYRVLEGPTDVFGLLLFLATAALIIAVVQAIRRLLDNLAHPGKAGTEGIIFSAERGHAWASWSGANGFICLGPQDNVAEMMEDFLAQVEVGKRLQGMQPQS